MYSTFIVGQDSEESASFLHSLLIGQGRKCCTIKKPKEDLTQDILHDIQKTQIDFMILSAEDPREIDKRYLSYGFNTVAYTNLLGEPQYSKPDFPELNAHDYAIVNTDDQNTIRFLRGMKATFITYGLNQKACITASSIQDEEINPMVQCCIQREFSTMKGVHLPPQEFPVSIPAGKKINIYCVLAAVASALVLGFQTDSMLASR